MTFKKIILFTLFLIAINIFAQEKHEPFYTGTVSEMIHVPSIASRSNFPESTTKEIQMMDGRASRNIIVPYKDVPTEDDYFVRNPNVLSQKVQGRTPDLVFDAFASSSQPTDPDLAVGPNHVFVVFNTGFRIFDKNGVALTGQLSPNPTIFPSSGCCDLTVSHDSAANRWVVSFLKDSGGAMIAVSDGPDPINDGWYVYTITAIQDYQKLSIWSDGYYITENTSNTNKVWAMEREQMLLGNTAAKVVGFNLPNLVDNGFYSPQAFNISAGTIPAAGNAPIVYLQDNAWSGITQDHIKLWLINVNWTNTTSSTISNPQQINTTDFISVFDNGSFSNLTQPGGGSAIDALQATIMNQAQFRKFPTHNAAVFNFVVDTDATTGEKAGIRWIELRQTGDGQPWSLYQEGTYTSPDNKHAWHGSLIMDVQGNIGMGYTAMSSATSTNTNVKVSSYYTGRYANDPLGTMTISEQLIANGNANISGTRYGDYNKIDVDPYDDKTFWFINEYVNSSRKGVVGRFKIAPNYNNDVGVVAITTPTSGALTASESVTVYLFNYGQNAVSNFPVTYQVNGGSIITEMFTGTIAPSTNATFTFATTSDFSTEGQTYTVISGTDLAGDEDITNDNATAVINHVYHNDIGVSQIISPESGGSLGNEAVTVVITNYGSMPQSNFQISYSLDGQTPITETVTATINPGATLTYTFTSAVDLSAFQTYQLLVTTNLNNDSINTNNSFVVVIVNSSCAINTNTNTATLGPNSGIVTNSIINISENYTVTKVTATINLTHSYDSDLDIYLKSPANTTVELSTDNGGSSNDYINTTFDDDSLNPITAASAPFTGTFKPEGLLSSFIGQSTMGNWTLSITDDANSDGGVLNNWTLNVCHNNVMSNEDVILESSDLKVAETANNFFEITLYSSKILANVLFTVYDVSGKQIVYHKIKNTDGKYFYPLDMTYAPTGVYFIRMGNDSISKVKKIIVK